MRTCKRVYYSGTVQGVGFRMTTRQIARQYSVAGYVRNLADGQVEVLVAGDADEIERFLGAVATRMASYIQDHRIIDASDEPTSFTTFEIWH
jgi:acylphosphatase